MSERLRFRCGSIGLKITRNVEARTFRNGLLLSRFRGCHSAVGAIGEKYFLSIAFTGNNNLASIKFVHLHRFDVLGVPKEIVAKSRYSICFEARGRLKENDS